VRRVLLVLALLCGVPGAGVAQSSIFGVRGLGIPQDPVSTRAAGTGGSLALLDGLSGTNPAAITSIVGLTASFNLFENGRTSTTPGGTGTASDGGFPFVTVVNRVKNSPLYFSGSFGSYTDRDFGIVTSGTAQVNGLPVDFRDSLESRGGTSDIRLAVGYRNGEKFALGLGLHFLTGSNRLTLGRTFSDSMIAAVRQRSELAFNAVGLSVGAVFHPTEALLLAGVVRRDGTMNVDRDSAQAFTVSLPWSFAGGAQYRFGEHGLLNAQLEYTTWSDASADLQAAGGVGAENTLRASVGGELTTHRQQPGNLPLRLGVRTAQLPFGFALGQQPTEYAVAAGSGIRFAKGRAVADAALERVWRNADGGFSETAWVFSLGFVLKP
jgi:hypothetical protein